MWIFSRTHDPKEETILGFDTNDMNNNAEVSPIPDVLIRFPDKEINITGELEMFKVYLRAAGYSDYIIDKIRCMEDVGERSTSISTGDEGQSGD